VLILQTELFDTAGCGVFSYPEQGSQLTTSTNVLVIVMDSLQYQWVRESKENIKETKMTVVSGGQKCF